MYHGLVKFNQKKVVTPFIVSVCLIQIKLLLVAVINQRITNSCELTNKNVKLKKFKFLKTIY